jgi:hypothetical protein
MVRRSQESSHSSAVAQRFVSNGTTVTGGMPGPSTASLKAPKPWSSTASRCQKSPFSCSCSSLCLETAAAVLMGRASGASGKFQRTAESA